MEGSSISVCQVKGKACQAMSPRAMASSMRFAIGGRGLLEVLVEQPRAGGPHIAALARRRLAAAAQCRWPGERISSK